MEKDNTEAANITRQTVTNLPLLNGITQHFLFPRVQFFDHFLVFSELVQTCKFFPKSIKMNPCTCYSCYCHYTSLIKMWEFSFNEHSTQTRH